MTGAPADSPVWLAFLGLSAVALARGQLTYWLGRVVGDRAGRRLAGRPGERALRSAARVEKGRELIRRWGVVAVPLCYLTVGLQTLVLAAAGLSAMTWRRFSLAQLPGALAWGAIYATVGWAAWTAAVSGAAAQPVFRLIVVVSGLGVLSAVVTRVLRRRAAPD